MILLKPSFVAIDHASSSEQEILEDLQLPEEYNAEMIYYTMAMGKQNYMLAMNFNLYTYMDRW